LQLRIPAAVWFIFCAVTAVAAQSGPPVPKLPPPPGSHAHPAPATPSKLSRPPIIFDATSLGSPLVLDKNWRIGITSNPAASSADFDDSSWAVRNAQASMQEVPDVDDSGVFSSGSGAKAELEGNSRRYAWFRLHIHLAPNHGPVALLIELPVSENTSVGVTSPGLSPDVFVNGLKLRPEGPNGNDPQHYQQISRIYNLNIAPSDTSLVLVLRIIYIPYGYGSYTGFFENRTLSLGNPTDLQRELNLWSNRNLFERLPRLIYSLLLVVLAIFLFVLYFAQKGHIEYLWLALHELVQAPIGFIEYAGSSAHLDIFWYAALVLELILISAYLFFEFLNAFLSLRRRWYIVALRYSAPILAFVGPTLLFIGRGKFIAILLTVVFLCSLLWIIGWFLFIFITLIAAAFKRNFEAGLFLIPIVFNLIGFIEPMVTATLSEEAGRSFHSPLSLQAGPIPIHFAAIGDFTGILVIVIIIFFRFLHVQRDQERVSNELAAARSVQELLIPQEKPATPGFEVDSVYNPANEVGGDFFHIQMVGRDGMIVVIGDVAGHGLKAAMNVSLLMGALRRTQERSPAKTLQSLNRVLSGTESFTTCQTIWFGANGEMVVANAGHLPPFLNSQEISLPGGLPLGVLADVSYEEARFYLHPGDRVLLLSDGVVEARQPSGELFGFERVRHFSQQSAFYIAEAAKSFGQQDDITVLTVRREAQALAA
jgi:Stage II sporulation protein E (SpoIIE)